MKFVRALRGGVICVLFGACSVETTLTSTPSPTTSPNTVDEGGSFRASCHVAPNPVAPPFEEATWSADVADGEEREIVDYRWTLLARPAGSSVGLATSGKNIPGFLPDLVGTYHAKVVLTDANGETSEPCETTLRAIALESFRVEMFWQHAGDDMDLHVLRDGGLRNTVDDCYFANCQFPDRLDWGDVGAADDDPRLDLDDIPGTGPENINIEFTRDASYVVAVHDYQRSSFQGGNDVTVRIYVDGEAVWEDTRTIRGEDSFTEFARVDGRTGAVESR